MVTEVPPFWGTEKAEYFRSNIWQVKTCENSLKLLKMHRQKYSCCFVIPCDTSQVCILMWMRVYSFGKIDLNNV